jgi:glycosyltransferase involved in cell wall biosynthesis
MRICLSTQRTYPNPLGGSEIYIHAIAKQFGTIDKITVIATDSSNRLPNSLSNSHAAYPVLVFRSVDWPVARLPILLIMKKEPSGLVGRAVSVPFDGLFHTATYGCFSPSMFSWLNGHKFDLLHSAAIPTAAAWAASHASKSSGTPFVLTPFLHLADRAFDLPYVNRMLRSAAHLIAVTATEKLYLQTKGISSDLISIIPPWVDIGSYSQGSRELFRSRFGISGEDFVVLIPSKWEDKGAFHTLRALLSLGEGGVRTTCVMLGQVDSWVQRRIDSEVRRLANSGVRVIDLGYLRGQALRDCLAGSDVLVEPSRTDSFGMVFQDAWMESRPVISARTGAIPDVVIDGENGLLVEFGSVSGIAQAILSLISQRDFAKELGAAGRRAICDKYSMTRLVPQLRGVYEASIRGR